MVFANAGIPVLLKEADQAALDRGHGQHSEELRQTRCSAAASLRNSSTSAATDQAGARLTTISHEADMVIEAVFEGMALKKQVFGELDRVCQARSDPRQQHLDAQHR